MKPIPVKGRGAFAVRTIISSEIIGLYTGRVQPMASYTHQSEDSGLSQPYCFNLITGPGNASELCITTSDEEPFGCTMYLNHDEKPNVNAIIGYYKRELIIVFYAAKRIIKDEELFLNYNGRDKTFPTPWEDE